MHQDITPHTDASELRIGIAISRYHSEITDRLLESAMEYFTSQGGHPDNLLVVPTPGAFELTVVCRAFSEIDNLDAALALGCVIAGETTHDQYINQSITQGLTSITLETGLPIGFGVLTCQSLEQARARAGGKIGNQGEEAMAAAIEITNTLLMLSEVEGGFLSQ